MAGKVKPIPEGYRTATPYLIFDGAGRAIEFYRQTFGAKELMRFSMPGSDKIGHAEIEIGDSRIMLADEYPDMGAKSPRAYGGSPISIMLYVEDVDAFVKKALGAGCKLEQPVQDKFYGDRSGTIQDPFGYTWHIGTHVEDVPPEELEKRAQAAATA